jgi:hypothetical protein
MLGALVVTLGVISLTRLDALPPVSAAGVFMNNPGEYPWGGLRFEQAGG